MEENQELKHICKFCNKSFPCGRSLGGHIRSHLINSDEVVEQKVNKKKLINGSNNKKINVGDEACPQIGYSLRENPKKTSKFAKSSEDTLLPSKLCKECGKGFQSWKALFGHMKCHSEKASNSVEEEDSCKHRLIMDSQSDNEAAAPSRKKRSRRRIKRYMVANTSSSLTVVNASPCVSETEQEKEEVAMSLILLSMDVGESSGNNSEFLESPFSSQTDQITKARGKHLKCNGGESAKLNKLKNGKLESTILDLEKIKPEAKVSGVPKKGSEMKISEVQTGEIIDGKLKKTKMDNGNGFEGSATESRKNFIKESGKDQPESTSKKSNSKKRKPIDQHDPELSVDNSKVAYGNTTSDIELYGSLERSSRFECTVCNRRFHSYQALGGHRASHKKIKGCSAAKIDSSENSTETELSPNQTADSKLIKSHSYDSMVEKFTEKFDSDHVIKKSKVHECPICFKVFPSGQALGGHKRSHLLAEAKKNHQNVVTQKSIPEVRDFLDLNLPPPVEEESSEQVGFMPWWTASKHEQLVLIKN